MILPPQTNMVDHQRTHLKKVSETLAAAEKKV